MKRTSCHFFLVLAVFTGALLGGSTVRAQPSSTNVIVGSIGVPGEQDSYTFNLTNRGRFYFDAISNVSALRWSLEGPNGILVDERSFGSSDAGNLDVQNLQPGFHQLTVRADGSTTTNYAFRFVDTSSAALITPGVLVTNRLTPANETDLYQYSAAAGDRFSFDRRAVDVSASVWLRLIDPYGNKLIDTVFTDINTWTQRVAGIYTILIEGFAGNTGSAGYAFSLDPQGNVTIPPFTGTQMTLGTVVAGNLTNPSTNDLVFSLGAETRAVFDSLTNSPNLQWTLAGPPGVIVSYRAINNSDGQNGGPMLELPAGDYQLRVRRTGAGTDPYRFRLLDVGTAAVVTPGVPVFGSLAPGTESRVYRLTASAGSTLFFDLHATNGSGNTEWRLFDPFGTTTTQGGLRTDRGPLQVSVSGNYTLLIEGYYTDSPAALPYRLDVVPVTNGLQALTLGVVTRGSIEVPGQIQEYLFGLTVPITLCFDARTNNTLRWSLSGSHGLIVNLRPFSSPDYSQPLLRLEPGEYVMTVSGIGDDTGAFAFRWLDVSLAPLINVGTPVNGILSPANETDVHRLAGTEGTIVYLDALGLSGAPSASWRFFDPYGDQLFHNFIADFGPLTLPSDGVYTLLVEGFNGDTGSGSYAFNISPVHDARQSLALETLVAGVLATPGQQQIYDFTLAGPSMLYFDSRSDSPLRWSLSGPSGLVVDRRPFSNPERNSRVLNLPAGDYLLTVNGLGDAVGQFEFLLRDLAGAAPITPGVSVLSQLNPANETDCFRFTAAAGDRFYFDFLSKTSLPNASWRLLDPVGLDLFDVFLADAGPITLTQSGLYTLLVEGYPSDTGSGSYSVNVVPVHDTTQPLILGTTINSALAQPGQAHRYTFTVTAPILAYFDAQANSTLRWALDGPDGNLANNRPFNAAQYSSLPYRLLPGRHVVTVTGLADEVDDYQFRLVDLATATAITPGDIVGSILSPGDETDYYRFNANAGDRIFLDWISRTGAPSSYWRLFDPYGRPVFGSFLSADGGTNRLLATGTYTLLIEGYPGDADGSYQFNVVPAGSVQVAPYTGTPISFGSTIAGNLATAITTNAYTFTLSSPTRLFFDGLVNSSATWTLEWPSGVLIDQRPFWRSDGSDQDALLDLAGGNYRLTLTGAAGAYSFRLLEASTASSFSPGVTVSNSIAPARATALHRFAGVAGQSFYLDGRTSAGFGVAANLRLYTPFGDALISCAVNTDEEPFVLPHTGEYLISIEGRYIDNNASGSYSFLLQPIVNETNTLVVGENVAGTFTVPGQRRYHRFSLPAPAVLFFDNLSNINFSWTLSGPTNTDARELWSSDSVDGNARLPLPAGDYAIQVDPPGDAIGSYAFRLLDAATATAFTLGTIVNGSLAPGNSTTLFRFTAVAGARYFFDGQPAPGFSTTPWVKFYAPLGGIFLSSSQVSSDQEVFTIPQSGTYLISVEGRYLDTSTNGMFALYLRPVVDGTNTFAIGQTASGTINTPGQRRFHQFTLSAPARLVFDNLANIGFPWFLTGPAGAIVENQQLWSSDSLDGNGMLRTHDGQILPAGQYSIIVDPNGPATGSYSFRLLDAAGATPFTPGTPVNGTVTPGNGSVLYRFTGAIGDRLYYDGRPATGFDTPAWVRLYAPSGDIVFGSQQLGADREVFTLPDDGSYLFAVEGRYVDTAPGGSFSFNFVPSPSQPPVPLFDTNVAPDLRVTGLAITPPAGLQSGQSATVTWSTRNEGNTATAGSFTERVTLRNTATSQIIVNRTLFHDQIVAGSIAPGQTRSRQLAVTLPDGPSGAGALEVTVTTDGLNNVFEQNSGGTAEGNNAASLAVNSALAPYPDLQVTGFAVAPTSGWLTGAVITVSWITTNAGTRAAGGSWTENLRVRNTNTAEVIVNASVDYDAAEPTNGDIPPGGSRLRSVEFVMPASAAFNGAFEVMLTTDASSLVFEYNGAGSAETNNARSIISVSAPDLVVSGLNVSADPGAQAGAALRIQWNTVNQGNVPVLGVFYERVTVRNTNTAEVLFNTFIPYNPASPGSGVIASGASVARSQTFALPDGARSVGRLEITLTVDAFNSLIELNGTGSGESNNGAQTQISIAPNAYPDLVATNVIAPATGRPGQSVPFIWTVRNVGTVPAVGPWSDQLFLSSDAVIGGDQFLASAYFNGTLNPGQSLTRTQLVTLPAFGAGNRFFVVESDSGGGVFEEFDNNNTAIASSPLSIPAALTLTLTPASVLESAGSQAVLGSITRNSDATSPLTVTLGHNAPGRVFSPASVSIPAGASSTAFFLAVVDDTIAASNILATVTASAPGHSGVTNIVTIVENDSPALTLRLSSATVSEGAGPISVTLTRNAQTNTPLVITLSSDRPGALSLPPAVTIAAGQTNATFNLSPVNDDLVTGTRVLNLFASANAYPSASARISVLDDDSVALTLQLSDPAVFENKVNPAAMATLTRSPISSGGLRVRLGTNGGGLVQIPAEVIIPANQPALSFPVNVLDDSLAFGSQTIVIRAEGLSDAGAAIPGAVATASLTVLENDGPTLSVTPAVAVLEEGHSTIVRVARNTPPTNALVVMLNATPAGQLSVPASVTIASGQFSTNVTVSGVVDGISDGVQEVTVRASSPGFNPGSAPVTVTDINVPDLVIFEVTAPTNALTDASISVVWSVTNSGLATATGTWVDEVYLSRDAQGANATLLTVVTNQGSLLVGESYALSRTFQLPSDPGNYWIVIRSDARAGIAEGSERNNSGVSAVLTVQPAYRATVSTETDAAISGTPIPLSGRTFFTTDGLPAPFRVATVRVNVNQTRRTFSVLSDANGIFSGVFRPISGEAGLYTVGADHPRVLTDLAQDQFTLLGLSAVPWDLTVRLAPQIPVSGRIDVRNLSPLPLTGLAVTTEGLPLDFNVTTHFTNHLAGSVTNELTYEIVSSLTTPVSGRFTLLITSLEGATLRIPVDYVVTPPTARLAAVPGSLENGMLRGAQTLVQFDVINEGGAASGELNVALPVVPWLSLISASPVPSIPPGGRTTLVLALSPAADLALTRYDGTLVVRGENTGLTVPFQFRALSEARGDIVLTVTDEHTYYAAGAPNVTNATVLLRDTISGDVVTNGVSDLHGEIRWQNILEGTYVLEASAPRHSPARGSVRVVPGTTSEQEIFMMRQEVSYEWKVVPTVVTDHYRVVLQPQFETEVPQPNLIVENPEIVPLVFPGQTSQFAIRLRNNGLISLLRVRIPAPYSPHYVITPLVTEIEELPAQSSVSVPVTIRLRDSGGADPGGGLRLASAGGCSGDDCVIQLPIDTRYRCGRNFVTKTASISLHAVCVPDTGCDFTSFLDTSSPTFFDDSLQAHRAEWNCLMGHMDECAKARVRGYLRSGNAGAVHFPPGALPPPFDGTNFGLSAFCVCGPPSRTNAIFTLASNILANLGWFGGGGSVYTFVAATVPGPCNAPARGAGLAPAAVGGAGGAGPGVCARVRLELSQDITMARAVFRGSLVLDNGGVTDLTGIQLAIDFRDATGRPAGSVFAIRGPTLNGITAIDGTGRLAGGTSGSVDYIFVPTMEAAPTAPTAYQIGGTLRFTLDGQALTVPLLPGQITVLPDARLQLEYFQQRDVFSDDPFTPELEPAEVFNLALRLRNTGAGIARNFQIASAAPRIIENEKGLLIDFKLLGAHIDDQPFTPSFNLSLGDINPGQSRVVVWDMTSTLQGKFIDYRASYVHVDAFGATNISLIDSVNVHEMIHVVRDERPGADSLPDFLVNDQADPASLPDIVYLSSGTNAPVSMALNPVVNPPVTSNALQVQLTATMPAGWCYVRLPNPGADFRLVSVRRSDGRFLRMPENAWTTDRTFPSSIPGALREKTLHLFDFDGTGSYTLTFAPIQMDTNPPVSAVVALPATSPATFAVEWDGDDGTGGTGIAYFDLYVSANGGAYSNWLAHTTQRSAVFEGALGGTYAFYSRATDLAGNQELTPPSADAQTTASSVNTAPSLLPISDAAIDEGVSFSVRAVAIDTDAPRQSLTYQLRQAPPGATIDTADGTIRWSTGETLGGTSNPFVVVVRDNGIPSLGATQSFSVVVRELNSAPSFADLPPDVLVDEETLLDYFVTASDPDVPAQALSWQLGPGAPLGLSLDSGSGRLNWLPGESRGPGEYLVTVFVRDIGAPSLSASRTLRVIVREVNRPPELAPIPSTFAALVQTSLAFTNSATDPDIPVQQFFFSLAPGAPRGARIQRSTGVFTWTPSPDYARTTNRITIQVTDNGVPSLTSSRTITVVVGDLLEARLGQAIVPAGQTGSVPVSFVSTVPATSAMFTFTTPGTRLTSFALDPPAFPLSSSTLDSLGGNRHRVRVQMMPGQFISGEQTLSNLRFVAAASQASAFVSLAVSEVAGVQADGLPVPRALGHPGRVAYLGAEPLLEATRSAGQVELWVYALPAPNYTVETTVDLRPIISWAPFWSGPVNNLLEVIPISPTNQARYFRARR